MNYSRAGTRMAKRRRHMLLRQSRRGIVDLEQRIAELERRTTRYRNAQFANTSSRSLS
jgi:hypothetical protein